MENRPVVPPSAAELQNYSLGKSEPDRAAEIASGIAGARLVTVPRCGHLSTLEQPEAVATMLREFLGSLG